MVLGIVVPEEGALENLVGFPEEVVREGEYVKLLTLTVFLCSFSDEDYARRILQQAIDVLPYEWEYFTRWVGKVSL